MNEQSRIPTQLYLWTLRFELHVIFMNHMGFFSTMTNVKTILSCGLYNTKTSGRRFGPWAVVCRNWFTEALAPVSKTPSSQQKWEPVGNWYIDDGASM